MFWLLVLSAHLYVMFGSESNVMPSQQIFVCLHQFFLLSCCLRLISRQNCAQSSYLFTNCRYISYLVFIFVWSVVAEKQLHVIRFNQMVRRSHTNKNPKKVLNKWLLCVPEQNDGAFRSSTNDQTEWPYRVNPMKTDATIFPTEMLLLPVRSVRLWGSKPIQFLHSHFY